jgi:hypothetical protein
VTSTWVLPANIDELAALRTSSDLLTLLHTGHPTIRLLGYHTINGTHLNTCPNNTTGDHNNDVITCAAEQRLAPCCAELTHSDLTDSICMADECVPFHQRGDLGSIADCISTVLRTITGELAPVQIVTAVGVVSLRHQELGVLYPWLTGLLHTYINTLRGGDTTSNITSLHYVPYAHRLTGTQHHTRLLIARSRLLLPGTTLLYLLDDAAAADLTNTDLANGNGDVPTWPLLHANNPDTLLEAARTLHTVLAESSWTGAHINNVIGDIARTVAALHPDVRIADRWQTTTRHN